jgi:hypothetical protein
MNPLTLRELRLRHAQLDERAECLRQQWRALPAGSSPSRAVALGKEVKDLQERADDYAALLRGLEAKP